MEHHSKFMRDGRRRKETDCPCIVFDLQLQGGNNAVLQTDMRAI